MPIWSLAAISYWGASGAPGAAYALGFPLGLGGPGNLARADARPRRRGGPAQLAVLAGAGAEGRLRRAQRLRSHSMTSARTDCAPDVLAVSITDRGLIEVHPADQRLHRPDRGRSHGEDAEPMAAKQNRLDGPPRVHLPQNDTGSDRSFSRQQLQRFCSDEVR